MFGWFKKEDGSISARLTRLEAEVSTMRVEYLASNEKVSRSLNELLKRYGQREYRENIDNENEMINGIMSSVDLSNPEQLKQLIKNPAVVQLAMKKIMGGI